MLQLLRITRHTLSVFITILVGARGMPCLRHLAIDYRMPTRAAIEQLAAAANLVKLSANGISEVSSTFRSHQACFQCGCQV